MRSWTQTDFLALHDDIVLTVAHLDVADVSDANIWSLVEVEVGLSDIHNFQRCSKFVVWMKLATLEKRYSP